MSSTASLITVLASVAFGLIGAGPWSSASDHERHPDQPGLQAPPCPRGGQPGAGVHQPSSHPSLGWLGGHPTRTPAPPELPPLGSVRSRSQRG